MSTASPCGEYLFLSEVAAHFRISVCAARNLARSGKLKTIKVGKRRLVPREAFERFLASLEQE